MIGFSHHCRFAGDRVTDNAKAVFGANNKGEKPVQVIKAGFQSLTQSCAVLHLPCEVGGPDFGVVLGFNVDAVAAQFAAQASCGWTAIRCAQGTGPRLC